ncbi:unnamed protein product, partial [Rotaria sp. Silwood1]
MRVLIFTVIFSSFPNLRLLFSVGWFYFGLGKRSLGHGA